MTTTKPAKKLRVVPKSVPESVDIYAKARAEIMLRDWGRIHTDADRREAVIIPDRPKGQWSR
jgi:hypothetical protein